MAKMFTRTRHHVTLYVVQYIVGIISKKLPTSIFKVDGISVFLLATLCTSGLSFAAPVIVELIANRTAELRREIRGVIKKKNTVNV